MRRLRRDVPSAEGAGDPRGACAEGRARRCAAARQSWQTPPPQASLATRSRRTPFSPNAAAAAATPLPPLLPLPSADAADVAAATPHAPICLLSLPQATRSTFRRRLTRFLMERPETSSLCCRSSRIRNTSARCGTHRTHCPRAVDYRMLSAPATNRHEYTGQYSTFPRAVPKTTSAG